MLSETKKNKVNGITFAAAKGLLVIFNCATNLVACELYKLSQTQSMIYSTISLVICHYLLHIKF